MKVKLLKKLRNRHKVIYYPGRREYEIRSVVYTWYGAIDSYELIHKTNDKELAILLLREAILVYARRNYSELCRKIEIK